MCDVPLASIQFATTIDVALIERALRAIDPTTHVEIRDSRTVWFGLRACATRDGCHYGNVAMLRRVFDMLIAPLHAEIGVERVRLGGMVTAAR